MNYFPPKASLNQKDHVFWAWAHMSCRNRHCAYSSRDNWLDQILGQVCQSHSSPACTPRRVFSDFPFVILLNLI